MINRQKLIEEFTKWRDAFDDKEDNMYILMQSVIEEIQSQPPADKWIPCSERLPEKNGIYIIDDCRHGNHWIHTAGFIKAREVWCENHGVCYDDYYGRYDDQEKIIAWMPLPEPYKKGE